MLFIIGSLTCSMAPSVGWLVVFRMLQAVGGSMLNPVAMSIIASTFNDPKQRARAVGVWGAVVGISLGIAHLLAEPTPETHISGSSKADTAAGTGAAVGEEAISAHRRVDHG